MSRHCGISLMCRASRVAPATHATHICKQHTHAAYRPSRTWTATWLARQRRGAGVLTVDLDRVDHHVLRLSQQRINDSNSLTWLRYQGASYCEHVMSVRECFITASARVIMQICVVHVRAYHRCRGTRHNANMCSACACISSL